MELIERQEPLAQLAALLAGAGAGRGAVALVSGPAAVGKSALLDVFAGQAAADATALTAVASGNESALRWGVLGQLARSAALPTPARDQLAELMASPRGPDGPETRVADALCAHLIELSVRTPLAVVVDDVQHADPASLTALGFLVRRIRDARIVVVLGHCAWPGLPIQAEVGRLPYCRSIKLAPLSAQGVAALLAGHLGRDAATRVAADVHRFSGGNPLIIEALVDDLKGIGDPEGPTVRAGEHYRRAVPSVLHRMGPDALATAAVIAAGGGAQDLARILGPDALPDAELRRAGLLGPGGFAHPAAAEAVLSALDPAARRDLGFRLAELAHADGRPVMVVAEHLLAADAAASDAPAGDAAAADAPPAPARAPWMVPALAEAAGQALAAGLVGVAIDCLRLGRRYSQDAVQRASLTTTLVRAEWRRDPAAPVPRLAELLAGMHAGHLSGGDALILVRALLWHGRVDDAATVLKLLAAGEALSDPETVSELRVTRPWLRSSFAGLLDHVPGPAAGADDPAVAPATLEARRREAAATILDTVLTSGPSDRLLDEAEHIARTARLERIGMDVIESALLALVYADQPQRAAARCDTFIAEAAAGQAPGRQARLTAIRAEIRARRGDFPGAEQDARAALAIIGPAGWGVALGACLGPLLAALDATGRHAEAVELLHLPLPAATLDSRFGLAYLRARGRVQLTGDDAAGALVDFQYCGELMARWGMDAPGLVPWRTDAAEACLALGRTAAARELIAEHLARYPRHTWPRAHAMGLRLSARLAAPRERPALLRQAADMLHACADHYGTALALTDLTAALAGLGETRRARIIGARAARAAGRCGAEPLLAVLAQYLDVAQYYDVDEYCDADETDPGAGPGEDDLSRAERRVADLAVQGLSNREIAQRLFITVSTVEQHLTKVYRKFGVSRRTDLAVARSAAQPSSSYP